MKLPPGVSEEDFLKAATKVINILAPRYTFGYNTVEDIKQEAMLLAMKGMAEYDVNRPLENFLYIHVHNRLINFRRNNFRRNDPPCLSCHNSMPGATEHPDGEYCERYASWLHRNIVKQNLINPLDLSNIDDEAESNTREESSVVEDVAKEELLSLIDIKLSVELRSTYLKMQSGQSVPKSKRETVERAIKDILKDNIECLTN